MKGDIDISSKANVHDSCAVAGDVEIKDFVAAGPRCVFQGTNHRMDRICMQDGFYIDKFGDRETLKISKITIEPNVWIGRQAMIMPGVTVGRGAVIAARAVVTHDVEPFEVVGGIPADHIRYRFDKEKREALEQVEWWKWSDIKIKENKEFFMTPISELTPEDIKGFE